MGAARPGLFSHGCLTLLTGAVLLLGACILTAPGFREGWTGLLVPRLLPPLPPPLPPPPLSVPWEPLLTREELLRGLAYWGSGRRLHRVAAKLLAGQPIKVYLLGGSITRGGGATGDRSLSWANRFFRFINASFPHSDHVFANKGISASTSFLFAPCMSYHVPPDADLVVLEFTMNEQADSPMTSPGRRSYESIIRQLLAYPGRPAILVLNFWAWWRTFSQADGVHQGLFYFPQAEVAFTTMAQYYDITSVSVRAATWHLQNVGIDTFKADKVVSPNMPHYYLLPNGSYYLGTIPTAPPDQANQYFYADGLHPYDTGHGVMAELLAYPLMRAVQEVQTGEALSAADRRGDPRLDALPPPMIPHSHDDRPSLCAMQKDFKPVIVATEGWEYLPERPSATEFADQKWGWRGTQPGQWAEMELDTRSKTYKGTALVWLSHLRSYEGMGTALVQCTQGCTCEPTWLDGTVKERVSIFWMAQIFVTQHERCRMRVTVGKEPGRYPDPQGRHKVTLVAAMVTHLTPTELQKTGTLQWATTDNQMHR